MVGKVETFKNSAGEFVDEALYNVGECVLGPEPVIDVVANCMNGPLEVVACAEGVHLRQDVIGVGDVVDGELYGSEANCVSEFDASGEDTLDARVLDVHARHVGEGGVGIQVQDYQSIVSRGFHGCS